MLMIGVNSSVNDEDRVYSYDAVGNRLTETARGTTYHYCYHPTDCSQGPSANRLYAIRTGSPTGPLHRQFSYDNAGRLLAKRDGAGTPRYTVSYDGQGRARAIATPVFADTFDYDPNAYRIRRNASDGYRKYLLEGEHLEAVYGAGDELQETYLRGVVVDELVSGYLYPTSTLHARINYTFHHDHLNSVTALTGHAGSLEETTRYDAFGAPLNITLPGTGNDRLYTGREYDRDSGLYYYRARYYDPEIGRFITEDPIGFAGGINFYAYVENNPENDH